MSDSERRKWNARYRERGGKIGTPSPFVTSLATRLPESGRALDLAGGAGRAERRIG